MARQAGLDYFPMAVDMLNDDKVYGIMAAAGGGNRKSVEAWAAKGWIDELLAQIYAHGFALEMTRGATEDLAHDLGMDAEALEGFIGTCIRHGLFDAGLWERSRVLTSAGIQKRYAVACKRGVKSLVGPYVLAESDEGDGIIPEIARNEPKSPEMSRNRPKSSAKEKEKEKEKWKEKEEEANRTGDVASALPCLAAEAGGSGIFFDLLGGAHKTPLGAIACSLGAADPAKFAASVRGLCPQGCRGDPERASECYGLIMRALEKFDPAKGSNPWPITRKVITEDRSFA